MISSNIKLPKFAMDAQVSLLNVKVLLGPSNYKTIIDPQDLQVAVVIFKHKFKSKTWR